MDMSWALIPGKRAHSYDLNVSVGTIWYVAYPRTNLESPPSLALTESPAKEFIFKYFNRVGKTTVT